MATYRFHQLDVFTRTPLKGNPLAVFPDARGLDEATMQALAREMNLSETTFITDSSEATKKVRFFTPASELPLAGHPTVGTWWLLAERKMIDAPAEGQFRVTQETKAGVLPVRITMAGGRPTRVVMTQASPQFEDPISDFTKLGRALGGDSKTVGRKPPPQVVSTGVPQMMIPIKSLEILQNLPSGGMGMTLAEFLSDHGSSCAMCFATDTVNPDATVHCRMFSPGIGIAEDPATGSAAGALGCYLVWHNIVRPHNGVAKIVVEQGLEIGRDSRIEVEIEVGNGGEITEVEVGGEAVAIIEGEVRL
jgi:trans-2,3-dihydro-3-hydroxyanthranilate isomerase